MDKQNIKPLDKREVLRLLRKGIKLMTKGYKAAYIMSQKDKDWVGKRILPHIMDLDEGLSEIIKNP
jgi:hypothetical protein